MSHELNIEVVSLDEVPSQAPEPTDKDQPRVVLVVDDEKVIADTISIILKHNGFSAMTAYNAESAIELANVVPPELLLSDVMMGDGMDGTQLAIHMVKQFPDCKILLFSGHGSTRDLLEKARAAGYNFPLLTKPLHPSELLSHVREVFAS